MAVLQEFSSACVHWTLGFTILIGLAISSFSGLGTVFALPISATSITLSALCGLSLIPSDTNFRKRKCCDILDFFKVWLEILEILTASATCARVASATVDYISNGRIREWFLGIESHSLGEPWPDVLGVSVIIVVAVLFMLGLEKSASFSALLCLGILMSYTFFVIVGGTHTVIEINFKFSQSFRAVSLQSVLTAAAMCAYGFVNTFPKFTSRKLFKIFAITLMPLILYSSTILVVTLMTNYRELTGTATPLLRVFELRDVDWARLVMSICIITTVLLALTEVLPLVFGLFLNLASNKWQIFLSSLQHRSTITGAPILTVFAAGSLVAILAFACPLSYLINILNTSTLLKCICISIQVIYEQYKPEFNNDTYLSNCTNTQYSKLKQSSTRTHQKSQQQQQPSTFPSCLFCWRKPKAVSLVSSNRCKTDSKADGTTTDKEYLLLNDYCDKSRDVILTEDSSGEESEQNESVLSSDVEESCSSTTDIDAVVQEYRERIQVATVDKFNENKYPTYTTTTIVFIFLITIIVTTICLSIFIILKIFYLFWPCYAALTVSSLIILFMPKNSIQSETKILPKCLTPICAIIALIINIILTAMIIEDVWPGFVFWFGAGLLLFWRCDCCTCEGLIFHQRNKINITKNFTQYKDKYVDTILIAR